MNAKTLAVCYLTMLSVPKLMSVEFWWNYSGREKPKYSE